MKNQVSKIRLISMFYLTIFTSALLISGFMGSQREMLPITKGKSSAILFSHHTDSALTVRGINVAAEPGSGAEDVAGSSKKHDLVPFDFDFSFSSLLQWFFKLPSKSLSQVNAGSSPVHGKPIWLSIHSLRI